MRIALLLLTCLLLCTGCNSRNHTITDVAASSIDKGAQNVGVVGDHLAETGRPNEGAILKQEAQRIETALALPEEKQIATASINKLDLKSENIATTVETNAADVQADAEAIGEAEKANGIMGWVQAGLTALASGGIIATALRGLGLPGAGLVDLALKTVFPKAFANEKALAQHKEVANVVMVAADVGREGLSALDKHIELLPDEIKLAILTAILEVSNGQAKTVDDLFKKKAIEVAVDAGRSLEVEALLKTVRDLNVSEAGKLKAVA